MLETIRRTGVMQLDPVTRVRRRSPISGKGVERAMQMIPFLPNYQRFDSEIVRSMSVAYTDLCRTLGLSTMPDAANEVVAHDHGNCRTRCADTHHYVPPRLGGIQGRQIALLSWWRSADLKVPPQQVAGKL